MSAYDNNRGSIVIPENSVFSSLNSNCGTIIVGHNCKIAECNNNRGFIQFGRGLCIGNIKNNFSHISIDNESKVDLIADNRGSITLASDCVLMHTKNNFGSIGGKPIFSSVDFDLSDDENSYDIRYNTTNIFSPSVVMEGSGSSNQENVRTIFHNLNLGSLGEGIVNLVSCLDSKTKSNSSEREKEKKHSNPTDHVLQDADERLCGICMDEPKSVAFQCGHLCCVNCSEMLISCHICRVKISQKIKLFL